MIQVISTSATTLTVPVAIGTAARRAMRMSAAPALKGWA